MSPMAPVGIGKRKRGDRTFSQDNRDEGQRPSPHRPEELGLGQHGVHHPNQQSPSYARDGFDSRGGPRRRGAGGRGGRGDRGGGSQRSPTTSQDKIPFQTPLNQVQPETKPHLTATLQTLSAQGPDSLESNKNTPSHPPDLGDGPSKEDFYIYDFLTEDRVLNWASYGKTQVVESGRESREKGDRTTLGLLYQELIHAGLHRRLSPIDAGSTVKDILGDVLDKGFEESSNTTSKNTTFDPASYFLDTLSVVAEYAPPSSELYTLVTSTKIPAQKMRRELDSGLLENLSLVRKNIFVRVGIRQQTNLLYRQSNYNLLREESEGYSKLVTDLFTTSSDEPPTSEVVEDTFERVKGMVGAFDLDVGRVLDISLDVFATVLVKQYRFFVKYLRASSWWPQSEPGRNLTDPKLGPLPRWAVPGYNSRALNGEDKDEIKLSRTHRDQAFWQSARKVGMPAFFELGGRQTDSAILESKLEATTASHSSPHEHDRKWMELTKTLPPPGNKIAAQVLGFKLRFYNSTARDPSDTLPVNLIYLAALLIKIGFVSLKDLYPHIWPTDDSMGGVREIKMKEKAERERNGRPGGGAPNALLSAAPLPDDDDIQPRESLRLREVENARRQALRAASTTEKSTPAVQTEDKSDELPEPAEQKVQLLKSLLSIGALPEALYMLGRFPWLMEAFQELPEYIHRILHHCLAKMYEPLRPLQDDNSLQEQQRIPDPDHPFVSKGLIKLTEAPPRRRKRWAQLDQDNVNEKDEVVDYKFYWDEWADTIPVCQSIDDVFTLCSTLLNLSGVKIGQDSTLLIKLARIGNHSLSVDQSTSNVGRWMDLSKRLLVPALSFTKCNPGVVHEVFELIKNFPSNVRFGIYAEWNLGQTSRQPDIKSAFDQARAETKDVLKRISRTTIKPMARALAKIAYANPGVVFSITIAQLEAYNNLVEVVVECARYFTYLAYDVLTWSLLSALGGQGRKRLQQDGMLTSRWLAALSLFAGKIFKRYSVMNPAPIIQYVADQLRLANSIDLIVLEEMTESMAGIASNINFNDQQVLALAGGDLLQSQTMMQLLDRRHESKITARRLMKALMDSNMVGQILISLAQERQTCIFKIEDQDAHPKLLGNLIDQLHRILTQYNELLRSNLTTSEFDQFVPCVQALISDFGLDPNLAFWICRPSISAAMAHYDAAHGVQNPELKGAVKEVLKEESMIVEGMSEEKDEQMQDLVESAKDPDADPRLPQKQESKAEGQDVEMKDAIQEVTPTAPDEATENDKSEPWHPVLKEVMQGLQIAFPKSTWDTISPAFFVTFWQCSLRDMCLPITSYHTEIKRLSSKVATINADRSDVSIAGSQRKEKEKKALNDLQLRLEQESRERLQNYSAVRNRLQEEKNQWFSGFWQRWDVLNVALIERCFFPRLILSSLDSEYSFRMLKFLHSSGAANFRTMGVYDQLFRDQRLTSMIFLCSAKEAEYFGRFINQVLNDLGRWHKEKKVFEKEAYGPKRDLPGFSKKLSDEKTILSFWDHDDFRRIMFKWHRNLSNALKTCLTSKEYMHVRNAINILNQVHQNFPAVTFMGQHQISCITEISQKEHREDLKIAAASLLGALKRREKDWVMPQAFNVVENATNSVPRPGISKTSTPQPETEIAKALNPKATEFQPKSQTDAEAKADISSGRKPIESEDGEIEDGSTLKSIVKDPPPLNGEVLEKAKLQVHMDTTDTSKVDGGSPRNGVASERKAPASQSSISMSSPNVPAVAGRQQPQTSANANSSAQLRPDMIRNASAGPISARGQQDSHSRPDIPSSRAEHRLPARVNDRLPPPEYQREPRPSDRLAGEPQRDMLRDRGFDRPSQGSPFYGTDRGENRLRGSERDRLDRYGGDGAPTPRLHNDDRFPGREGRQLHRDERGLNSADQRPLPDQGYRRPDVTGPESLDRNPMLPPRSMMPQHPDRAALIHSNPDSSRQPPVNRLSERRSESGRYHDYPASEHNSRGPSPSRGHERGPQYETRRNERRQDEGPRASEEPQYARPKYSEPHAPTGPRTEHSSYAGSAPASDRFRDGARTAASNHAGHDMNHGRLNQDNGRGAWQAESQYGRLNAGSDVPSGPRVSNGSNQPPSRNVRPANASQPQTRSQNPASARSAPPVIPTVENNDSNGVSTRHREANRDEAKASKSPSQMPPTANPDAIGMHPDRLKAFQGAEPPSSQNGLERSESGRGLRNQPPSATSNSSTKGPPPSPVQQSPQSRGAPPPSGPASSGERGRDKRLAVMQNFIQQSNGNQAPERSNQGTSIRGRGGRVPQSPSASGPPPSSNANRESDSARDDLFGGRASVPSISGNVEEEGDYGRGRRGQSQRDNYTEGERRNTRARSRSPRGERTHEMGTQAPYRDRDRGFPPRDGPREHFRDENQSYSMRSGGGQDREMRRPPPGHPERDVRSGPPPVRRSTRESTMDARAQQDLGYDRRSEDRRDGGGSLRKRGRGAEESAGERPPPDSKRPRR